MSERENVVILGNSESDSDLYYTTGFHVTVPVIYLELGGRKLLLVNDLEYGRARVEAKVDEVLSWTPYEERLRSINEPPRIASILDQFLKERGIRHLTVPAGFSFAYAERLRERGYILSLRDDPFYPQRTVKKPEELQAIEEAQRHNEAAMGHAVAILGASEIRGDLLFHRGEALTSERLRFEIQRFLLERNCMAAEIIVAGGDQGADPHQRGTGPLPANQTIILDIFPRSLTTRYWGDMTRTVVRGKASPAVHKLYGDVLAAQELAFSLLRDGAEGQQIHEKVADLLKSRGNPNEESRGKKTGFIHGTGHGIGLDLHESPRMGKIGARIQAGQVVTVEPGLYYPGVGAVRIEDVVVVTRNGCRNLNRFPKVLEV